MTTRRLVLSAIVVLATLVCLALPVISAAQQTERIPRIGYLSPLSAQADAAFREAFRQGLRTLGYIEGQSVVIEARYADGGLDRLPALAAELVRQNVDVIVASPTPAVRAAQRATRTTPIVMVSGDPVGEGFIVGLARPGGNITGQSTTAAEIAAKRVEFLKAIVPSLAQVTHLTTPEVAKTVMMETDAAGRRLGVRVMTTVIRKPAELDQAFVAMRSANVGGVVVSLSLQDHWKQIVELALKSRLPTVSGPQAFVEAGGLMAYGPDYPDLFRRAATYVAKILKGAKPADLPVEQPTKFQFVVNRKTAKALGLTIPAGLLLQADHVID